MTEGRISTSQSGHRVILRDFSSDIAGGGKSLKFLKNWLDGGFKDFLLSLLLGEMIQLVAEKNGKEQEIFVASCSNNRIHVWNIYLYCTVYIHLTKCIQSEYSTGVLCALFLLEKMDNKMEEKVENPAIVHSPMLNGVQHFKSLRRAGTFANDHRHHLSTDGVSGPTVLPL